MRGTFLPQVAELQMEEASRKIAEAIQARRRCLGLNYPPPEPIPPEVFAGCRTIADRIIAVRRYHDAGGREAGEEEKRP